MTSEYYQPTREPPVNGTPGFNGDTLRHAASAQSRPGASFLPAAFATISSSTLFGAFS